MDCKGHAMVEHSHSSPGWVEPSAATTRSKASQLGLPDPIRYGCQLREASISCRTRRPSVFSGDPANNIDDEHDCWNQRGDCGLLRVRLSDRGHSKFRHDLVDRLASLGGSFQVLDKLLQLHARLYR